MDMGLAEVRRGQDGLCFQDTAPAPAPGRAAPRR